MSDNGETQSLYIQEITELRDQVRRLQGEKAAIYENRDELLARIRQIDDQLVIAKVDAQQLQADGLDTLKDYQNCVEAFRKCTMALKVMVQFARTVIDHAEHREMPSKKLLESTAYIMSTFEEDGLIP